MNCADAQKIWNHNGGLIGGLNCRGHGYHEVMPYLVQLAYDFVAKKPDPFDDAVKRISGDGNYRVTHSDGESDLMRRVHDVIGDQAACDIVSRTVGGIVGVPTLHFANICCNGCSVSDGSLTLQQIFNIQMAAVNTNPDGTPVVR